MPGCNLDHGPVSIRPVVAIHCERLRLSARNHQLGAIPVVLDLMQPSVTLPRLGYKRRAKRRDESGKNGRFGPLGYA
jgi:hypothetical protein